MIARPPSPAALPRLAYVGEVPVRNISAGPALLYRLLETYPADRLLVAESDHVPADPPFELPGIARARFFLFHQRLLRSRFSAFYGSWTYRRAAARSRRLLPRLRAFRTDAVLGIAHGYGWLTAAECAQRLGVPLHLIAHDHWRGTATLPASLAPAADRRFGEIYRAAATRLPVSPQMEAHYRQLYGAAGTVVYPSRSAGALQLDRPPLRPPAPGAFLFAYAGNAGSSGQRRALADFANAIAPLGARLRIYQGLSLDLLRHAGLRTDNVEIATFRPADALHRDLVATVDALYLPMSFAADERENTRLCFPSKLADYTVAGLPILVRSPADGTAAAWAQAHPAAADLVTTEDPGILAATVQRLIADDAHRHALAHAALAVGRRMFSHAAVYETFCQALRSAHPSAPSP